MNFVERIINWLDKTAFSGAMGVGPWIVPIAPAVIFGYALYVSLTEQGMNFELKLIASVTASIGLVIAGAITSHTAINTADSRNWILVIGYISLEIGGLLLMHIDQNFKVIGIVISLLTLIVYVSRAIMTKENLEFKKLETERELNRQLEFKQKQLELKREQAEWEAEQEQMKIDAEIQREKELIAQQLRHEKAMAKINNKAVSLESHRSLTETKNETNSRILEGILNNETGNVSEIATNLGFGRATIYRHIKKHVQAGTIYKNGKGYELIDNQ